MPYMVSDSDVSQQSRPVVDRVGRFDTRPLTNRPPRRSARRFRAETAAGLHGDDLTEPRWWWRAERTWLALLLGPLAVGLPAVLLPAEGITSFTVAVSLLWCVAWALVLATLLWLLRDDHWGPRVGRRHRLTEFARVNGLGYEATPSVSRPAAHLFASAPKRRHLDRFEVPGPRGFVVANYEETWDDGVGEASGYEAGYAILRLRESYPRTLVARKTPVRVKALREVTPVPGPGKLLIRSTKPEYPLLRQLLESGVVEQAMAFGRSTQIEIVGDELFVLRGAFWKLTSERFWTRMAALAETVAPFLDTSTEPTPTATLALRPAEEGAPNRYVSDAGTG
ncbi:hypothetical protein [Streptomyces sp. NPDC005438]|uniref:hypothetical protein n=1 Tax=Streptomyces sp. NPDC005438 TaxID=3156880 RepID=UPI0033B57FF3